MFFCIDKMRISTLFVGLLTLVVLVLLLFSAYNLTQGIEQREQPEDDSALNSIAPYQSQSVDIDPRLYSYLYGEYNEEVDFRDRRRTSDDDGDDDDDEEPSEAETGMEFCSDGLDNDEDGDFDGDDSDCVDITIESFELMYPEEPNIRQPTFYYIVIRNTGYVDIDANTILWQFDLGDGVVFNGEIGSVLEIGDPYDLSPSHTYEGAGDFNVVVSIDYNNLIDEFDEEDNEFELLISVVE